MLKRKLRPPNVLEFFPPLRLALGISRLGASATGSELMSRHDAGASSGAKCGGESDVVDFGIGAPDGAAGDGDFEFAWEIIEFGIAGEFLVESEDQRRGVDEFVRVHAGKRAAGDIAGDVAAGARGRKTDRPEFFEDVGDGLDRHPVELDILADGNVCDTVAVF